MSEPVSIQPNAVTALAGELRAVAAGLAGADDPCRCAQAAFGAALEGETGARAGAVAAAWAGLAGLLAHECDALAGTLTGAVQSYAAAEAARSALIEQRRLPVDEGPR